MGATKLCQGVVMKGHGQGWAGGMGGVGGQWPGVRASWQSGPGAYLGTVLGHGMVVEASLGLELFPAVLAFERVLQLQTQPHQKLAKGHLPSWHLWGCLTF